MNGLLSRILKISVILAGIVVIISVLIAGGIVYLNNPPATIPQTGGGRSLRIEDGNILYMEVKNGESAFSVGRRLEDAGIIKNRYFWYALSRLEKEYIKTGTYRIQLPASQLAIHAALVAGRQVLLRVTIPEGTTLKKTARILAEAEICGEDAFLLAAADPEILEAYKVPGKNMEGFLYPDTYLFPLEYPAPLVVRNMADTFFSKLAELAPESLDAAPEEIYKKLIVASIVEREYRIDEEAPLMAGVFYNRLRIGMALQSCATVEYVLTEIQGKPHPEVLLTRDTEIKDPYNTYYYPGLPPGPISSPGAAALKAAFYPSETEYLYFRLVDANAGRHYFSRTFDDHIKAGILYVKGGLSS
ncbi:MAG: endolytic transglycosylase MltG [Treponema sp.]|jgi:UPF0755 protein|nr:endolytic transglycosylase MltG [Treponema sp.]